MSEQVCMTRHCGRARTGLYQAKGNREGPAMICCMTLIELLALSGPSFHTGTGCVRNIHSRGPHSLQASPTLGPHPQRLLEPCQGSASSPQAFPFLSLTPPLSPSYSFFSLFSMTFIKGKQRDP